MRKIVLIVVLIFTSGFVFSQTIGGEIKYKSLPSPPNFPRSYEFTLTKYTVFPGTGSLQTALIFTGDGGSTLVIRTDSVLLCNNVLKSRYVFSHTYPPIIGAITYSIYNYDSTGLTGLRNYPGGSNVRFFEANLNDYQSLWGLQSSAIFNNDPIFLADNDVVLKNSSSATEPDGDSLSYELKDIDGFANGYWIPNGVSIGPNNGEVIWNMPDTLGYYEFYVIVREWRKFGNQYYPMSYNPRSYIVKIDTLQSSHYFLGTGSWATDGNGHYQAHIQPNANLSISFIYEDTNANAISLNAYSETFALNNSASFSVKTSPHSDTGFYNWMPNISQVRNFPYVVDFRGESTMNGSCISQDLTLMIYVDQLNLVENNLNIDNNILIYPNPAKESLVINYNLHGKNATLQIYNLLGEVVVTIEIENASTTKTISVRDLVSGVYTMRLTGDGFSVTRKLLVE